MTLEMIQAEYDALTTAANDRLYQIRLGNHETLAYAVEEFNRINDRRVKLMGLLNLIPAGQA